MKRLTGYLFFVFAFLTVSCQSPVSSSANMTITHVGWSADSTPSDWWSATATNRPGLVYNFTLYFDGNVNASDIAYARVYLPGNKNLWWTFDLSNQFNGASKSIGGSTNFWESDNFNELHFGTMTAEVKLVSGKLVDYDFVTGLPGGAANSGASIVYSPSAESTPSYPSVSSPAMTCPIVNSASFGGTGTTITFTVLGQNINNGRVWFYDAANNYIGKSMSFRDQTTGATNSIFGSGTFSRTSGSSNTVLVPSNGITDRSGNVISSAQYQTITHCRVYIYDGIQYATGSNPSYTDFDYRAISSLY
jgi:hypothetical protein